MQRAAFLMAASLTAWTAIPQDLPPEVLLLSRVRNHISEEVDRLVTVSCLETVHRELQQPRGRMRPLDTIRLEVLTNGDKEVFASPGDRKFSERHPLSYAGGGTLGDGLFGPYLKKVLLNQNVSDQYKGEEEVGGRRLARYEYRLPLMFSGQTIETPEGSGKVGLHGSFWVDPETSDVARLDLSADDFPPTLPVTEMTTSITYARTRLTRDFVALLPQAADVRLAKYSGEISHNQVEFTHCRVFGAESTIDFSAPDSPAPPPRFSAAALDDTLRPFPGGLQVAVKLRTRITSGMAVGALIDGIVADNVTAKHSVVIPAPVRGRLRRLESYNDPFPYFIVGLEFTEVEVQGIRCLFYADLLDIESAPGVELRLTTRNTMATQNNDLVLGNTSTHQTIESLSVYRLPGVATFFFKSGTLALPQDFRTVWKTLPAKP